MEPKFLGYAVHQEDSDEFLADWEHGGLDAFGWIWSRYPGDAQIHASIEEAKKPAQQYGKNAIMVELFDDGDRFLVSPISDNNHPQR